MRGARSRARFAVTLGLALACPSFALNPTLDISQYSHKAWKVSEGFTRGPINAIAQTPDGYLWLGTEFGLLRFDGVRNVEWTPPAQQQLPSNTIDRLLVTRDGTLWIGTYKGLASWKSGRLTAYAELAGLAVFALLEDHEGTVWAGGYGVPNGKLCAIRNGAVQCHGEDGSLGGGVGSLYEFKGDLWAGTEAGLFRWKPGPPKFFPLPGGSIQDLIEGDNGTLWIAKSFGVRQLKDGRIEAYRLPVNEQVEPTRLLRDREGGLWIGTGGQGLWHLRQGRADVFKSADGLSGDQVRGLFEDREGDIWAATSDGLDRFRELAVPTISVKQGLSNGVVGSVVPARDGSVWVATIDGLNRWNNGQITIYRKRSGGPLARLAQRPGVRERYDEGLPQNSLESLLEDDRGRIWVPTRGGIAYLEDDRFSSVGVLPSVLAVHAMAQDGAGNLWLGDLYRGLLHLRDGKLVEQIPWERLGHQDSADALVSDRGQGGLFLGFVQGGVAYFKDRQIRAAYTASDGLGNGIVRDLRLDRDGTLWAATEGGLSRLKNGRIATLTRKNGLSCDTVHATIEDDDHSVWLRLACGMMRVPRGELDAWVADPNRTIQGTVFDSSDGVRDRAIVPTTKPAAAKSADGKLWFVTEGGVSVVDPRHLPFNRLQPPVHVEQVIADRKTYAAGAKLPELVRDVEIDYTALSFVAPEKMRFRYKLEGYDGDWQEAGNRRQAFYTNLGPHAYRFRVMASNNSGVWNEAGASLDFSVAPAYYQTTWFRAGVVVAFFAVLWGLYRYRLRQMARVFDARMEARVGERTRVARDLHDTLLQSFQGVLLKFSTVPYIMRSRPDEAEEMLKGYIDQARAAITEGRDAVQGLRSSVAVTNDLARAIISFGQGLTADQAGPDCPEFRLLVEGKSKELPPLVRDEVYKIACESLRNAFRHAQAKRIEVQIRYDPRQFRLQLVDNGKGIDPAVLSAGGRAGHHGLQGLHERAELAGGKLSVWSQLNSGTEIQLTIPASIAYPKSKTPAAKTASATNAGKGDE